MDIGAVFFLKRGKMMRKMTPTERSSEASYEFVWNAPKHNVLCVILRIIFPIKKKTEPMFYLLIPCDILKLSVFPIILRLLS